MDRKPFFSDETIEFTGNYIATVGRRKQAVAQVRLYTDGGKGVVMINGKKPREYFLDKGISVIAQPLRVSSHQHDYNFSILVKGGGVSGQIDAIKLGIARAVLQADPESHDILKANGFLTRDARKVERKKPGFKKARKRPQWSKR